MHRTCTFFQSIRNIMV